MFLDSFFYFLAIIIFLIVAVTGSWVLNSVNDDVQQDADLTNQSKVILDDLNTNLPTWFDYGVATVIILLWILVLVASFYIDSHPVFFVVSAIVLMIAIFAVNQFMDGITDYLEDPEIAIVTQNFPISMFFVANIEKFVAIVGFSIAIALYAKYKA